MKKLIQLHPLDNVQIVVDEIREGEFIELNNSRFYFDKYIGIGHKIAGRFIPKGEKIIKYGVPIGSATVDIGIGKHMCICTI